LRVIDGIKKEKINKNNYYINAYNRAIDKYILSQKREDFIKICLLSVKIIANIDPHQPFNVDSLFDLLKRVDLTSQILGDLTPKEIVNVFPITKTINKKCETNLIDYNYTMNIVNTLVPELPIELQTDTWKFLSNYINKDIRCFIILSLKVVGDIQSISGEDSIYDEFLRLDGEDKKKKRPRYLKLL
jgi:hypothetical protein